MSEPEPKIGIVSAMEREVAPMLRLWTRDTVAYQGRRYRVVRSRCGGKVYIACGIGRRCAIEATEALIAAERPQAIISAGFAGALSPAGGVGQRIAPGVVLDAETGERFFCADGGEGVLVSAPEVAGCEFKKQLALRFKAEAVDMEAAAVARVAQMHGVAFYVVKAISDELDFPMPPLHRFVSADGQLETARFVAHISIRPRYWASVIRLGRNSRRARVELCQGLERLTAELRSRRESILRA